MSAVGLLPPLSEESLHIVGMTCAACQAHVQRALQSVPGVDSVSVDLLGHRARVTGQHPLDPATLRAAVRRAGYDTSERPSTQTTDAASDKGAQVTESGGFLGWRAALSLVAGGLAMLLSMPLMADTTNSTGMDPLSRLLLRISMPLMPPLLLHVPAEALRWTLFALALSTMLFAAPEIYSAAWRAARHRATNMNTLVALGTLSAFAISTVVTVADALRRPLSLFGDVYYEAVVLILGFLLAGRWLEARARTRALRDLESFARFEVKEARWLAEGAPADPQSLFSAPETLLPLDALATGDVLRVLPGDRIPLDAQILAGRSALDESMLTGEPLPVTRSPGDRVLGGTLNLDGALILQATATGADSTLAQMTRLLERARSSRAPLQHLADRASAIFVPSVLGLATLTFLAWAIADNTGSHHLGLARAISLSIAVLVIACPCAMGLAVPATVAVAMGTAAHAGILFKDGEAFERLAQAEIIAFDKTGTLTTGKPTVLAFEPVPGSPFPTHQLLRWAHAVETLSTHPLALAICRYAREQGTTQAPDALTAASVLPGIGAEGTVDGHHVAVGSDALLSSSFTRNANYPDATPMYLLVDGQPQGTFYAIDTLRASAHDIAQTMQRLGLRSVLLTGDTLAAAQHLAAATGITDIHARLLPADKVLAIESLQQEGQRIAMVGDGLNDAAALAQADAGIAVASGTDLARDAGHILLLHHDLHLIPLALRLARKTRRLMRQNLGWALVYNLLGLPVAAGVLLPRFGIALSPALASAAMALSSVSVLLNALRLTRIPTAWRPHQPTATGTVNSGQTA